MSNFIIHDGELYHYGVPGMKWGHRRAMRKLDRALIRSARAEKRLTESTYKLINKIDNSKKPMSDRAFKRENKKIGKLAKKYRQITAQGDLLAHRTVRKYGAAKFKEMAEASTKGKERAHAILNSVKKPNA